MEEQPRVVLEGDAARRYLEQQQDEDDCEYLDTADAFEGLVLARIANRPDMAEEVLDCIDGPIAETAYPNEVEAFYKTANDPDRFMSNLIYNPNLPNGTLEMIAQCGNLKTRGLVALKLLRDKSRAWTEQTVAELFEIAARLG